MALAVPLLLANTAAGAAIAGAIGVTVGTLATVTSIAFQVTGINDKINKAASKVFGEDLVQVANLAGMAYAGFNGGWQSEGLSGVLGGAEVAAGGADVASVADKAFEADWASSGAMEVPSGAISPGNVFDKIKPQASTTASNGLDLRNGGSILGDGQLSMADNSTRTLEMAEAAAPTATVEPVSKYAIAPNAAGTSAPNAAGTSAAARTSTGLNAADSNATSGLGLKASGDALAPQKGFFERLIANAGDKTIAGLVQGAAQGYSAAQASKTAEQRAAEERRRYYSTPTFKVNPYKAPA